MISETRLYKEMETQFDDYIEKCTLTSLKADGYADCYNDVINIVSKMVEENRIKASARRNVKKLLKNQ